MNKKPIDKISSRHVRVTLRDIAKRCGVSMISASAAIRGDRRQVSESTDLRIRRIAEEMGYDPSATAYARRLRYCAESKQILNQVVGLHFAWDYIDSPYYIRLFHSLGTGMTKFGYSILTNWSLNRNDLKLPAPFARGEVDGVFHVSGSSSELLLSLLRAEPGFGNRPIVSIFEKLPGSSAVLMDDFAGGRQIAGHLLANGHRSLFHFETANQQQKERINGMRSAMQEAGSSDGIHPVFFNMQEPARSIASLKQRMNEFPSCSAIFCGNDHNAIIIHNWLLEMGLRVPQDISLVGFDNTHELRDRQGLNILTTVEIPLEDAGRTASEIMVGRIEGRTSENNTVMLPVKLLPRSSVMPPPSRQRRKFN